MNNTSSTTEIPGDDPSPRMEDTWSHILLPFYIIVVILTVLGNTLVCVAIYVDRRLRSPTNWFIASLAVSDLFYALAGLPFRISSVVMPIPHVAVCRVWIWVDMLCVAASLANLAVISVDRYLKITRPFAYQRRMTQRRSYYAIGGVWAYAATVATLSIIKWPGAKGIVLIGGDCGNYNRVFYGVANIVTFLLPLMVLIASYTMIYRAAWIQFQKMEHITVSPTNQEDKRKQKNVRRDFKATKTLAVVLGTFTICWGPFFIMFTVMQYDSEYMRHISNRKVAEAVFHIFILVLPNLNSTCNPLIYAYFNMEYRRAFKKIMLSICDRHGQKYGSYKRRSSLTSFFQSAFARRATPPSDDGNHNQQDCIEDKELFINGDATLVTQI